MQIVTNSDDVFCEILWYTKLSYTRISQAADGHFAHFLNNRYWW